MPAQKAPCVPKDHNGRQYYCSMELALMMIGGKWKPIIIWYLADKGTQRFGELRKALPAVTQKMLTQQLRELEADGLLIRESYPEMPPRVEYSLTDKGRSLVPILKQLNDWGRQMEADETRRPRGTAESSHGAAPPSRAV